jgi:hypothetical protein
MIFGKKFDTFIGKGLTTAGNITRNLGSLGMGVNRALSSPIVRAGIQGTGLALDGETAGLSGAVATGVNFLGGDKFRGIAGDVQGAGNFMTKLGNRLQSKYK